MTQAPAGITPQHRPDRIDGRSVGERRLAPALWSGALSRCPACGSGKMFARYLKVVDQCGACDEALHHHRADDAPPYFTISIVGHVIVGLMLLVEMTFRPELWVHWILWIPLTVILSLLLLPPVKGALVALQWALLMHGFDPDHAEEDGSPAAGQQEDGWPYPPPRS